MAKRKNSRFCFDLPQGWEDQTVYHFIGPEESGLRHSVRMVIDRTLLKKEIKQFARVKTQPIADSLQSIEVLKDEETTVGGCFPSYEFVYKWVLGEKRTMINNCVFVIADGMGFCFEARFSKKSYKTVGLQLRDIVEAILPGTFEPQDED